MKRALLAAILATISFALPAAAADDPILARLVGDWTGRGTWRQSADAQPERIFCKISNTLVQNGAALQQRGRCSVASSSGSVDGIISANGGGRYSGTLNSLASQGAASLSGTGSGSRLVLDTTYVDARSHEPAKSVTTMQLSGSGYRLTTQRRDGANTWTGSDINFTK